MTVSKALQFAFQISYEYFQKPQTRFSIKIINYDLCVFYFYLILYIYVCTCTHVDIHIYYTYSVMCIHFIFVRIFIVIILRFTHSYTLFVLTLLSCILHNCSLLVKLVHKNFTGMCCTSLPAHVM